MAKQMDGKVVLITGSGSGIGRATALKFASEGAKVVVSDIQKDGGNETVRMIMDKGGEAIFIKADISKESDVATLIRKTIETYGHLDCAHNNAGIEGQQGSTTDQNEDNWEKVININLKGVWLCMKYEIAQMLKQKYGAIVNTASVAGLVGFTGIAPYVASKHGVIGLTKTAALEYAKENIRINAVCPGVIHTPMIDRFTKGNKEAEAQFISMEPVGRMGEPEEIAEAVFWLCSDGASFVTGHSLAVDGGFVAQ